MTTNRPGYRTDRPFTVDDLTANEYATLARLIKADPTSAFADPSSVHGGDALAGLVMLRDRRDQPSATLGTYQARTMGDLQRELGFIPDPELLDEFDDLDEPGPELDDDEGPETGPTLLDRATENAATVVGEPVDPSTPPGSPSSQ